MPQLSDTMTEGMIVKWLKKEGEPVKAGEIVAEVETDKATMEMESFESGTLASITVHEGEKAAVGATIAVIAKAGEKVAEVKGSASGGSGQRARSAIAGAPVGAVASASDATTGGTGTTTLAPEDYPEDGEAEPAEDDPHKVASLAQAEAISTIGKPEADGHNGYTRIKASPLAKRVAAELGVVLEGLQGTGPGGRIIQSDVVTASQKQPPKSEKSPPGLAASAASASPPKAAPPTRVPTGQTEKITLNKMRQTIAQRLQQSKQTIPHFYETIDIDMTAATALRKKLVEAYEKKEGIRISIGDVVAKAVAAALKAVPQLNSTFDEKTMTVTRYGDVNLGMAVALPDGLIVPVLRNIDQMGIKEIRQRSADLVDRARGQKLKREEMSGATFTVSNLGLMGIREFSAIVNPPEVGILAIGASEDKAVVRPSSTGPQVVVRNIMTVTLSCDHRVIDGAVAAAFLVALKNFLEEPAMMLV
jgi:pyruvate dehydrogenase E2 component (dihydrolipoamide acetyltransferase)